MSRTCEEMKPFLKIISNLNLLPKQTTAFNRSNYLVNSTRAQIYCKLPYYKDTLVQRVIYESLGICFVNWFFIGLSLQVMVLSYNVHISAQEDRSSFSYIHIITTQKNILQESVKHMYLKFDILFCFITHTNTQRYCVSKIVLSSFRANSLYENGKL